MSSQVTTAFVQQYSANVQMLSQQMGSRLRDAVRIENVVGKNAFIDQIGKATAQLRTSRHADTPQLDTPHARRRLSLASYEYADLIDDQDKVRMLIDPTSFYAQAAAAAMGRAMDDVIITAALGTASTGETGSGKSIIIKSIQYLKGAKFNKDDLRKGAESASIEALVSINNKDMHLKRKISKNFVPYFSAEDLLITYSPAVNNAGTSSSVPLPIDNGTFP